MAAVGIVWFVRADRGAERFERNNRLISLALFASNMLLVVALVSWQLQV